MNLLPLDRFNHWYDHQPEPRRLLLALGFASPAILTSGISVGWTLVAIAWCCILIGVRVSASRI